MGVKLLPSIMLKRGTVASQYRENLRDVPQVHCIEQRTHDAPWVFGIQVEDRSIRDAIRERLARFGIETRNYFYPLHLEPVNFYGEDAGAYDISLPGAEHAAQVGFYLPTHSFLEPQDVSYICGIVKQFFNPDQEVPTVHRSVGWADEARSKILQGDDAV